VSGRAAFRGTVDLQVWALTVNGLRGAKSAERSREPLMIKLPALGRAGQTRRHNGWSGEHCCLFGEELAGCVGVADCGLVADAEYGGEVEWVGSG